jgi:hypothetical protein
MPDAPADHSALSILKRYRPDQILLWVIALSSLALNLVMLNQVLSLRRASGQAIADAIEVINRVEGQTFTTKVVIDDQIKIDTAIPVNETIPILIKQNLPIDTTVTVPVDAGLLGIIPLTVPIKANVPVEIKQEVTINQPFEVKTSVPIKLEVPVTIRVADTELAATLADIKARLIGLASQLGAATETPTEASHE